ncbi:MAG: hypothetical protein AABX02_03665 [archaeon]
MHQKKESGQATIELLLILSVLFVLLAMSLVIAGNQQIISNQKEESFSLHRNAQELANGLTFTHNAPIGTKTHIFLPPGPARQTFYVKNGVIEGYSNSTGIVVAVPSKQWTSPTLYDGNFVTLTKDWNSVVIQVGYQ